MTQLEIIGQRMAGRPKAYASRTESQPRNWIVWLTMRQYYKMGVTNHYQSLLVVRSPCFLLTQTMLKGNTVHAVSTAWHTLVLRYLSAIEIYMYLKSHVYSSVLHGWLLRCYDLCNNHCQILSNRTILGTCMVIITGRKLFAISLFHLKVQWEETDSKSFS